jgi:hypothetical protein
VERAWLKTQLAAWYAEQKWEVRTSLLDLQKLCKEAACL